MRRSSAFTVLFACLLLISATVIATGSLIAASAWTPVGERPAPTQRPQPPGPGGPGPGGPPGGGTYSAFLEEVRAGSVQFVDHNGGELYVQTEQFGYNVEVPDGVDDVHADIVAAAAAGGVDPPRYARDGVETPIGERSYEDMLSEIGEGAVFGVTQEGDDLSYDTERGRYRVVPFDPGRDVVADIREAASAAGVDPPSYTWFQSP